MSEEESKLSGNECSDLGEEGNSDLPRFFTPNGKGPSLPKSIITSKQGAKRALSTACKVPGPRVVKNLRVYRPVIMRWQEEASIHER